MVAGALLACPECCLRVDLFPALLLRLACCLLLDLRAFLDFGREDLLPAEDESEDNAPLVDTDCSLEDAAEMMTLHVSFCRLCQ